MLKQLYLIFSLVIGLTGLALAADIPASEASAKLYAAKCAMCHGKDFKGNPAMAKVFKLEPAALSFVSNDVKNKKDDELINTITKGKNKMPAFEGKLKPEEIAGLVAYLRSAATEKQPAK